MKRTALLAALLTSAACLGTSATALSQTYPSKPIRLLNQFNPGSSGDTTFRLLAEEMSKLAGQPVVVEGRAGGGGMVAAVMVSQSPPDGHVLLGATSALVVTHKFLSKHMEIDPQKDLTPVTKVGEAVVVFSVNAKMPIHSMEEFIAYARQNPGKLTYGTSGVGSENHFAAEQVRQLAKINIIHVPYKASSAALTDTVGGQLASTFSIYSVTVPHIQSGKVRPIAVVREKRYPGLPDLPTLGEAVPGFELPPTWIALFAPPKMPEAVLRRVNADAVKAMGVPEMAKKLAVGGFELQPTTPEELANLISHQIELVGRIVKAAGIKPR